jgi:hypothetical protein
MLVDNWMDPKTNNFRILVKHDAGTGKTRLALGLTSRFAKLFQDMFNSGPKNYSPTIYIVSYVKHNYFKDLMTLPEFGFISEAELEELQRLRGISENASAKDISALKDFEVKIKKRLSNRQHGGFYKFIGYKELFNRLFRISSDIHDVAIQADEEEFLELISAGKIAINTDFLDTFVNSVMICDEIHNAYNSVEMNNYGMSIKLIMSIFENPDAYSNYVDLAGKTYFEENRGQLYRNAGLKLLLLSATPYNSIGEVVDLINILTPLAELPEKRFLRRSDIIKDNSLLPTAKKVIQDALRGKISFLRDANIKLYPTKTFLGEKIVIPEKYKSLRSVGYNKKYIPYVKFTRCKMSKLHEATYKAMVKNGERPNNDSINIYDMVFPNPESETIGLYSNKTLKSIASAPQTWKDKHGVGVVDRMMTGNIWNLDNIGKYSTKYEHLCKDAIKLLGSDNGGKLIISHQFVSWAGVLGLQELFLNNGYITESAPSTGTTRCSICGTINDRHTTGNPGNHTFKPARIFVIHSGIDKNYIDKVKERYNSRANLWGHEIAIIIGSEILNVGLDFTAVQHLWVVHKPDKFSILIQIIHRGVRNGSHLDLPPEKRNVNIRIYTHRLSSDSELSFEEEAYFMKSQEYIEIQKAELYTNMVAIDSSINKSKIFPGDEDDKHDEYEGFNPLYYDIKPMKLGDVTDDSYNIWYGVKEINDIIYIIKRLFVEQSQIWRYDALLKSVTNPPFNTNFNTALIDKDNFKIALKLLITATEFSADKVFSNAASLVKSLFNHVNKYVYIQGAAHTIVYTGEKTNGFYILVPVEKKVVRPGLLGYSYNQLSDKARVDIGTWKLQDIGLESSIDITDSINTTSLSYNEMKIKFLKTYGNIPTRFMPYSFEIYHLDFHIRLIQDCISYMFARLTGKNITSDSHDLYVKMLYFYDHLDLIVFANYITDPEYKKYTTMKKIKKDFNPFLMHSIYNSSGESNFNPENINNFIDKKAVKIPEEMLPVGHLLEMGKFKKYNPKSDSWEYGNILDITDIKFSETKETENNIVIGFSDRTSNSLAPKFKVRDPLHKIVVGTDIRFLKTGIVCEYKPKNEIIDLCHTLGIEDDVRGSSVKEMCDKIKLELMKREMDERNKIRHMADAQRKKYKKIRWYYMPYEKQPEIV